MSELLILLRKLYAFVAEEPVPQDMLDKLEQMK